MASVEDMFSECFQLGRAIRCGDSEAFCKAYDELTICDPKLLETAKELIRQISDLAIKDFDALEEAYKYQSQRWPEFSINFTTTVSETIHRYLKKVLRQLTKAEQSTSDSGVHSGSEIDSVCGAEEKTKDKEKHDCSQPLILSSIFQSATERQVTEETVLIRGLHVYSNGEIVMAQDHEQCADHQVSEELHNPAVSSHPAHCNFNYYEAVNFLWNEWCLASSDHTTTLVSSTAAAVQ